MTLDNNHIVLTKEEVMQLSQGYAVLKTPQETNLDKMTLIYVREK